MAGERCADMVERLQQEEERVRGAREHLLAQLRTAAARVLEVAHQVFAGTTYMALLAGGQAALQRAGSAGSVGAEARARADSWRR